MRRAFRRGHRARRRCRRAPDRTACRRVSPGAQVGSHLARSARHLRRIRSKTGCQSQFDLPAGAGRGRRHDRDERCARAARVVDNVVPLLRSCARVDSETVIFWFLADVDRPVGRAPESHLHVACGRVCWTRVRVDRRFFSFSPRFWCPGGPRAVAGRDFLGGVRKIQFSKVDLKINARTRRARARWRLISRGLKCHVFKYSRSALRARRALRALLASPETRAACSARLTRDRACGLGGALRRATLLTSAPHPPRAGSPGESTGGAGGVRRGPCVPGRRSPGRVGARAARVVEASCACGAGGITRSNGEKRRARERAKKVNGPRPIE